MAGADRVRVALDPVQPKPDLDPKDILAIGLANIASKFKWAYGGLCPMAGFRA